MVTSGAAKLPSGPGGPALLQSLRYHRDPYTFLRSCQRKYGDWFTVKQIPCGTIVCVADPDAVHAIFAEHGAHRVGSITEFTTPILGHGLLRLDGAAHAATRRWLAPSFAPERIAYFTAEIRTLVEAELATWPIGEPFQLRPRLEALSVRIIVQFLFGASAMPRLAGLVPSLLALKKRDIAMGVRNALPLGFAKWALSGGGARNLSKIDRMLYDEIAARRASTVENGGMLAGMLSRQPADTPASDRQLRDELMTLVFAGHEPLATTLAWTFERILRHPDVMRELRVRGEDYREAVLLETMRVRAALGDVARELGEPFEAAGMHLPIGTRVCPSIVLLHLREETFRDAETFRPERFLDGTAAANPKPWLYLPFGGGQRRCLGADLAMLEMQAIVEAVLASADLRAPNAAPERGISDGITIGPHKGCLVMMERRR